MYWLAQELHSIADAIGPVPDLAEEHLRSIAGELEMGTWKPFHERVTALLQTPSSTD